MATKSHPGVAVWYMGFGDDLVFLDGGLRQILTIHRVLSKLTGDADDATYLMLSGKDIVACPVSPEAAEVMVAWLESVNVKCLIEDTSIVDE